MNLKEKVEKHKKLIVFFILSITVLSMMFLSVTAYQRGYDDGRNAIYLDPYSTEDQWFAVNHSFVRVYKWEITGNDTWRFYWEWISFENMSGLRLIQFPLDGVMWTNIPFGLVKTPDAVKIAEE